MALIVGALFLTKITYYGRNIEPIPLINGVSFMSKCQVFSFLNNLNEVVEDGLYMQAVVGDKISVGVVNFVEPGGPEIAPKSHSHGEEVTLQIKGGCAVYLGD